VNALKVCPQCGTEYPANARFCEIDGTALRSAGNEQGDMVGTIVAERYHVMKKLGEGGMGQVYLAEHVKMGRKSALKVMHPGMVKDVDAISRFNREAANASRISHPNVAAVYDFGETADGVIFLAMEFVDGPPLTKVIEQAGSLPPKRAATIVYQTAEALAVAHDLGIVHRDLKPDNIMVARTRDGGDLVKVVDFGIAKAANSDAQKVTKTGLVVGTPEYMSPEQLAGDKLDGRSDIYALALVAFNMLTGTLPFPSDSAQESMIMRLTDRPKPLSEMRPEVSWPADVQAVMDKALEREAALRYQNATDFGRDLQRAIERMPETAAAEMGTQMIQVPPTRVAAPAGEVLPRTSVAKAVAAGPGATVSVPAPVSAPSVTQAAAPAKSSNKVALVGGSIAAIVVLGAAAFALNGNFGAKAADTTTQPIVSTPPTGNDTTGKGVAPAGQPTSNVPTSTQTSSASGNPPPTNNQGAERLLADQLRTLIDGSQIPAQARAILASVDRLATRAKSSEELYLVAVLRSNAFASLIDTTRACKTLKDVFPKLEPKDTAGVNNKIELYSCPP
jgi:eukaryotic-like serine/threonine-protein kinase